MNSELLLDMSQLNMMGNSGLLILMKYFLKVMKYLSTSFMHMEPSPSYFYPRRPDSLVIDVDDILIQLSPTTITGQAYHFLEDDTEQATTVLQLKNTEAF